MSMRIKTNIESVTTQRYLKNNSDDLGQSIEKLASGERINRSLDDAAGLAISENLKAKTRGLGQAIRNANDGISFLQVAETGLNQISGVLIRLRELTVQAASDTLGMNQREYLDKEYQQLVHEIDRLSETTEFNDRKLLTADSLKDMVIQVGYNDTEDDRLTVTLNEPSIDGISTESLQLDGTTLHLEDRAQIAENLNNIDFGLEVITRSRANLGATESRLSSAIESMGVRRENMMAANSIIRDVDFAYETAELAKNKMLTQGNIAVLQTANLAPEMALQLLRQ